MAKHAVSASRFIGATPQKVYTILADYRQHHPRIVPPEWFKKLEVEEGGIGTGTKTCLELQILGSKRVVHHVVSEPEPGRVLVESDVDGSSTTTFYVDPTQGDGTRLTITTEIETRTGILGVIERALMSWALGRIYRKELELIASYAVKFRETIG
jgi:hypothetical protein